MSKPRVAKIENYQPEVRFKLTPFDRIKLGNTRNYLVKGLIPREGLVVIWGPPKCGKTFWTFDLVMHVALGREYRGRRIEPGTVVYVACEGERGLMARTEAFRQSKMAEEIGIVPFYLLTTRLDLAADIDILIGDIRAQISEAACAAIVIDTLNRSIRGSESSDEDMGAYVKALDAIREAFKCAVIVIHHCGIDDRRPRGHTSLTGAADAQIAVTRDAAGRVITEVEWMKDGPEGARTVSTLEVIELGTDVDGEQITSCIVTECDEGAERRRRAVKVSGAAKVALDILGRHDRRRTGRVLRSTTTYRPPHAWCRLDLWRDHVYKGSVADSDKPDAQRKAFGRAVTRLQELGLIRDMG